MAKQSKGASSKKSSEEKVTEEAGTPKKTRKNAVRKPAMDRAMKRARLLVKNSNAMHKLMRGFKGETTEEQSDALADTLANLEQVTKFAAQILLDTELLHTSGYAPLTSRVAGPKDPLPAGAIVALKEKHFESGVYGKLNAFEVVVDGGKQVRIRVQGDLKSPQIVVSRGWLAVVEMSPAATPESELADLDVESDESSEVDE